MIGRIVRPADFERVLKAPQRSRSAHFAAHHLGALPGRPQRPGAKGTADELSTGEPAPGTLPVDDPATTIPLQGCWLGLVVPKRHARRAVTRALLKRQIREAVKRHAQHLPPGLWVLRLRAPIDRAKFPSAASDALRAAMRAELDRLLSRIAAA